MNSNPKAPPPSKFAALTEWLRRRPLTAVGLSGAYLGLNLGAVALLASPPYPTIPFSKTFQVWEYDFGVQSGGTGEPVKNHKLTVSFEPPAYVNVDLPVVVTVSDVEGGQFNVKVLIELKTTGLVVTPKQGKSVSLENGKKVKFFVGSNRIGTWHLWAHDRQGVVEAPGIFDNPGPTSPIGATRPSISDTDSNELEIPFVEKPMFWILDRQTVNDLKTLSAIVGIPGLILFLLGSLKGRATKTEPEPPRHVIRPTESYRKPRRFDR